MKKFILFIFTGVLLLLAACTKKDSSKIWVNTTIGLSYVDQNGKDLLNPQTPSAYNLNDFRLYYMKNGKKTLFFRGNLDNPFGYSPAWYSPGSGLYRFALFFPADSCTLQLSDGTADTFKINVLQKNGSQLLQKVWMNGRLIWEASSLKEQYFIVHKQVK